MDFEDLVSDYTNPQWLRRIKRYVSTGGDINAACDEWYGGTLLHGAAQGRRINIIEWLVENGANVDATDDSGNTPLHIAVLEEIEGSFHYGRLSDFKASKALVAAGCNTTLRNQKGEKPKDIARRYRASEITSALSKFL